MAAGGNTVATSAKCPAITTKQGAIQIDTVCYGVDGCKSGWFYARLDSNGISHGTVPHLADLLRSIPGTARIFLDIPIGLRDQSGEGRGCDVEARKLLGPGRSSSVFNAPIRAILDDTSYASANEKSKQLAGKGLSQQSFAIVPKIREIDRLMGSSERARSLIREVHPEVCFYGLADRQAMKYAKKTREGLQERLAILTGYHPEAAQFVQQSLSAYLRKDVAADDILDALVCAITASMPEKWRTVPESPEIASTGLPMEMVYCEV